MWTGLRTVAFTDDPSPNDQFHDVGELVEVSVNVTVNGAVPEVGVAVKFATGDAGLEKNLINHIFPYRCRVFVIG